MTEGVFTYDRPCNTIKFSRPGYNDFVLERSAQSTTSVEREVLTVPRVGKAVLRLSAPDSYGQLAFYLTREATEILFAELEGKHTELEARYLKQGSGGPLSQADAFELMRFFGEFSFGLRQREERFGLAR